MKCGHDLRSNKGTRFQMRFSTILPLPTGLLCAAMMAWAPLAHGQEAGGTLAKITETLRHKVRLLPPAVAARTDNLNDRFWLYLPKRYERADEKAPMPLIIYLHGSSRRGRDVEEVKANGLAALMDELDDFEFVVASPQALSKYAWQRLLATRRPDPLARSPSGDSITSIPSASISPVSAWVVTEPGPR